MKSVVWMLSCAALAAPLVGCDTDEDEKVRATGPGGNGGRSGDPGNVVAPDQPVVPAGKQGRPRTFEVRIENVSAGSPLETSISPGVWVTHRDANPLFEEGQPDYDTGLEAIAEDGDPDKLAIWLEHDRKAVSSGRFDTVVDSVEPGPALPKTAFEFDVKATPGTKLSFATMLVQSNDYFFAPSGEGIALFDAQGKALPGRDVTSLVQTWNAGTEHDQAPGMGPDQAARQLIPNSGAAEGVVSRFSQPTRALPSPRAIVNVSVAQFEGTYYFVISNVSRKTAVIETPLAPIFWATHDASWALFEPGTHASAGLESLAEDASPSRLVADTAGTPGVGQVAGVSIVDGKATPGPAMPGESYIFEVTPDAEHPFLTLAAMVGESNDAFIATPPTGIRLLGPKGAVREAIDVREDLMRGLATWDAGTEANEPPGVGVNQAPRQLAPDTGLADPDDTVRLYADSTNDLAGPALGGFASVSVTPAANGAFTLTVTNTSQSTAYPGSLSPLAYVIHDGGARLFENTQPASAGLERLAEDGMAGELLEQLGSVASVKYAAVSDTPIGPGESYSVVVTPDAAHRYLDIASMVMPSNDTFMAFDPGGIALLDANGAPRTEAEIANDIAAHLAAWDAGTELNQAGAAGPDQAPRQEAPNTGVTEGDGTVRSASSSIWPIPDTRQLIRVTIGPKLPKVPPPH